MAGQEQSSLPTPTHLWQSPRNLSRALASYPGSSVPRLSSGGSNAWAGMLVSSEVQARNQHSSALWLIVGLESQETLGVPKFRGTQTKETQARAPRRKGATGS